jgi:hypothetical protein
MAGIVTALETDHGVGVMGQQIDDLALAFIAPLGPENYYRSCHFSAPLRSNGPG